ncbi:hypothetical protein ACROYT_G040947 [Oculina patagonica]
MRQRYCSLNFLYVTPVKADDTQADGSKTNQFQRFNNLNLSTRTQFLKPSLCTDLRRTDRAYDKSGETLPRAQRSHLILVRVESAYIF